MRIVTSTADLAYPYILFDYIDYENSYVKYNLMGCIQAESSKTYNFKLSLKELKSYSLDNWSKLRNSVDGNKIRIDSLSDWKDCNLKKLNFIKIDLLILKVIGKIKTKKIQVQNILMMQAL